MADSASDHLPISLAEQRRMMVDRQVRTFDVTDQIVTTRMLDVARDLFVPPAQRALAYSDCAIELPGSDGPRSRTLLPPFLIGRMLQAAEPKETDRVLDVAGGTGYTAALLAGLAADVLAVESDDALRAAATENFATLGVSNVRTAATTGDAGTEHFDLVFVNGCMEDGWSKLGDLLAPNGRMVAIIPKPSGSTMAALISGRGEGLSVRPLFDAQAPVLTAFKRPPAFVL